VLPKSATGNGEATIRFMPPAPNSAVWVATFFEHRFKGVGNLWFIKHCPKTLSEDRRCPVCEYVKPLWQTNRQLASQRGRKVHHISNIVVLADGNRENRGKLFLYDFGKTVFDKVKEKASSNCFYSFTRGANFNLRSKKVKGFTKYEDSFFSAPSPLNAPEEALEALWKRLHDLSEFVRPELIEPYEAMKANLEVVLEEKLKTVDDTEYFSKLQED
jgi:hypothetical protein